MSLLYEIIKIKYVREGFLPDYPHHLISDKEMFQAFINSENPSAMSYFSETYPLECEELKPQYDALVTNIQELVDDAIKNKSTPPDWVFSYMLGVVIGPNSEQHDRHDLLVLLNRDNPDDVLTEDSYKDCLAVSSKWVKRYTTPRAPSMFGEPHVIKSLRLHWSDLKR